MPTKINYPFPNSSGGASLEFAGPVNASQSLDTSGYYFSDNLTENIGIDCSGLGLGAHVNWVNLSTKAIVFYGLATVNGTTIPANKGVRIEANTSIEFFLKDANFNARVLAGSYTLSWVPGQEPIGQYLPFTSTATLDGVVNWLGTNFGTSSFSNPYPSLIGITGKVTTLGDDTPSVNNPSYLTNKSSVDKINFTGVSGTGSDVGALVSLPSGKTLIPTTIAVFFGNDSGLGSQSVILTVEGQKEDGNFEVIGVATCAGYSNAFRVFNYSGSSKFKGFYIHCPFIYYCSLREFEAWGHYG